MAARSWLLGLLIVLTFGSWAMAQEADTRARAAHVVNRLSFGPAPGDIDRAVSKGVRAWVAEQLAPETLAEPDLLLRRIAPLKTQEMDTVRLFRAYGPKAPGGPRTRPTLDEIKAARKKAAIILVEAAQAKLWRAILSPRQLQEVMIDFWYNHFNISARKGLDHLWVGSFEREAIRPNALGKFPELLAAVTKHPAMLIAYDNWQSAAPESPQGKGRPRPLITSHAREILASQTMGPKGFTPVDVTSLARMLAGWSIGAPRAATDRNGFVFDERRHESKDKTFLGTVIKGGGINEGEKALAYLALRPETARFVCGKLARRFLGQDPGKDLEERLAKTYLETKGDIRAVLAALFDSPEFFDPKVVGDAFKPPLRYVLGAVRAAGRPVSDVSGLARAIADMGQPLYDCPSAQGYKDDRDSWLTAEGQLTRLLFASKAGEGILDCWGPDPSGSPADYKAPAPLDPDLLAKTLGFEPEALTRRVMDACTPRLKAAVLLAGPQAQSY